MEALVVGDSHLTGRNPVGRKDDLTEVQFDKWDKIIHLSNSFDVPIIHTGDIFNVAVIANTLLTRFGDMLTGLNHPMYFVWGNHDLQYHSFDMWDRTSLGVLWSNNNKVRHISEFQNDYGITFDYIDWEAPIQQHGKHEFLLSHKAILSEKKMGKNSWVIKDTQFCLNIDKEGLLLRGYKLIICGHWHKRFIYKHKGTLVINPGPVTRQSVEEWLIPSVTLLNLDTLIRKEIKLTDREPEEVLSRTHIQKHHESITENVQKFVDLLNNKKFSHKKSYLKTLMHNLDQHELPMKVETIIRITIADLIEKGVIDESL